jgi:hypothetical protein
MGGYVGGWLVKEGDGWLRKGIVAKKGDGWLSWQRVRLLRQHE